jgi:hypothetical protein
MGADKSFFGFYFLHFYTKNTYIASKFMPGIVQSNKFDNFGLII